MEGIISGYTKKKAAGILEDIKQKNAHDPAAMEKSTIETIHHFYELSNRGKRFAIILLLMARSLEMIGIDQYKHLREMWGYKEYAPDIEEALRKPEPAKDDFTQLF